jgi:hypothetical protein
VDGPTIYLQRKTCDGPVLIHPGVRTLPSMPPLPAETKAQPQAVAIEGQITGGPRP